jgi:hypothetical protein
MSIKLQNKFFYIKQETTRQCACSAIATQHWGCGVLGVQPEDIQLLQEYPIAVWWEFYTRIWISIHPKLWWCKNQAIMTLQTTARVVEHLIKFCPTTSVSLWQMKDTSTYLAVSTNRTFASGQMKIHSSSIISLVIVHMTYLFGVELQTSESHALISLKMKMGE